MLQAYMFMTRIADRLKKEEGAGMAEYALLLVLIAAVVILVIPAFSTAVSSAFTSITNSINNAN